ANGNNEITANVLNPILIAMLQQPNDLIGDFDDSTIAGATLIEKLEALKTFFSEGGKISKESERWSDISIPGTHIIPFLNENNRNININLAPNNGSFEGFNSSSDLSQMWDGNLLFLRNGKNTPLTVTH